MPTDFSRPPPDARGPQVAQVIELVDDDKPKGKSGYRSSEEYGIPRGSIVGHSRGQGGSSAFDASQQMTIHVDPHIPGKSYDIEPGQLTKTEDQVKPNDVPPAGFDDQEARDTTHSALFREIRKSATEGLARARAETPAVAPTQQAGRQSHFDEEPQMARKPKSQPIAPPPPPPPAPEPEPEPPAEMLQQPAPQPTRVAMPALPNKQIVFSFGPPYGEMQARYHDIFKEGNNLVLVWDLQCDYLPMYTPSESRGLINVRVGSRQTPFKVLSLGITFVDEQSLKRYIVLLIDESVPEQPSEELDHAEERPTGSRLVAM